MQSASDYHEFYDRLGREYEETATVYATHLGRVRFRAVFQQLQPFALRHYRLLDIGCNDGVYSMPYCRLGGVAHGIDISEALVEKARAKCATEQLPATFEVADIEEYHPAEGFDIVLMSEVLEHVRHPDVAVRNAVAAVKRGGYFLISTPLPYSGFRTYLKRLVARRPLTQSMEFENFGVRYRHDGYYPLALKDWLEGFGLTCVTARTLGRELTLKSPFRLLLGCGNLQLHLKQR